MKTTDPSEPTKKIEVFSLVELCVLVQRTPREVRRVLHDLGMLPAYEVNGRDCWDSGHLENLFEFFNDQEK